LLAGEPLPHVPVTPQTLIGLQSALGSDPYWHSRFLSVHADPRLGSLDGHTGLACADAASPAAPASPSDATFPPHPQQTSPKTTQQPRNTIPLGLTLCTRAPPSWACTKSSWPQMQRTRLAHRYSRRPRRPCFRAMKSPHIRIGYRNPSNRKGRCNSDSIPRWSTAHCYRHRSRRRSHTGACIDPNWPRCVDTRGPMGTLNHPGSARDHPKYSHSVYNEDIRRCHSYMSAGSHNPNRCCSSAAAEAPPS
jgi:hypothetical protein